MKLIGKIIRKLKLSKAAFAVLSFFTPRKTPAPDPDEAMTILNEIHPDPGNSCILPEPRKNTADPEFDLDIIIPCYNAEKYLHECIDSVLAQDTKYRWRVIAIDDGSTDGTRDFGTKDNYYRNLEKAVRAGDYGRYRLFCALN